MAWVTKVEVDKKDMDYIIGTCDQCCGYFPRVQATVDKEMSYKIYCPNCNDIVETKMLWTSVMKWNKKIREKGDSKK